MHWTSREGLPGWLVLLFEYFFFVSPISFDAGPLFSVRLMESIICWVDDSFSSALSGVLDILRLLDWVACLYLGVLLPHARLLRFGGFVDSLLCNGSSFESFEGSGFMLGLAFLEGLGFRKELGLILGLGFLEGLGFRNKFGLMFGLGFLL